MKRPILYIAIGYIIGIIVGLYFDQSIVFLYIPVIVIYFIRKLINRFTFKEKNKKLKILSLKRYFRYIKIYFNFKVIILIMVTSIISNVNIIIQNKKYEKIYDELSNTESINFIGTIISNKLEKQYYNKYKIKTTYNNQKIEFYIMTDKKTEFEYGDKISISGTYIKPEIRRNHMGFDYSEYLEQLKVYGTIKCSNCKIIAKNSTAKIFELSNQILNTIKINMNKVLEKENSSILLGLLLGDKENIDKETQENFKSASMSHILAVSGMHIAYIILGIQISFNKLIGKQKTNVLIIFILIFYMFITNFSPSITRAGVMGIIMIFSKIIYRKNDIYTSISISLLLILVYNPFLIRNLGVLLSYGGVLGIILFNKTILKILNSVKIKNKIYKYMIRPKIYKYIDKAKEIISISISVQILIIPIIIYNLNTFNPYFLISNLILSIVIGPIVILGFIFIILLLININLASSIFKVTELSIKILIFISKIGEIPFSKIYIATPSLFSIIIYYLMLVVLFYTFNIFLPKNPNKTQIRLRNLFALLKIKSRKNKKKITLILVFIVLIFVVLKFIPHDLKIHFIDVGQGDSCLIVTPQNKTILIDGGGSMNSDFDVGENTLLPYILDRGFTKIDVIIVSHFDADHVRTGY